MSEKILVPVLGESISEATVSKWLKNKGDIVNADEAIVELETDKVNLEVPATTSGILSEINSNEGDTVKVGSVLAVISDPKVTTDKVQEIELKKNKIPNKEEKNNNIKLEEDNKIISDHQEEPLMLNEEEEPLILNEEVEEEKKLQLQEKNKNLSPAVRKIVSEKKIDIDQVEGTGKDGRILKGDLINLMGASPQPNERKI